MSDFQPADTFISSKNQKVRNGNMVKKKGKWKNSGGADDAALYVLFL